MEDGNSHKGGNIKIITQKTSEEILTKAIAENKTFLLSEKVEETLLMFQEVRSLWVRYGSQEKVIKVLQKPPYNLEYKLAWDYASKCPSLFSCVARSITRDFYIDIHLEKVETTWRMAQAIGDVKGMAAADKNRAHAIEKLLGTNKAIDKDLLRLPDILMAFRPEWFPNVPSMDSAEFLKIKRLYTEKVTRRRKIELGEEIDFEEIE
jgi:hypothetical protein